MSHNRTTDAAPAAPDRDNKQWFHDDEFNTTLRAWVAEEVRICYGDGVMGVNFAQGLAAFLDARNLALVRNLP